MIMRMMSRNNTSEKLLEQIDGAVKDLGRGLRGGAEADRGQPRGYGQDRGDPVREGDDVGRLVPQHPGRVHRYPRGEPRGGPGNRHPLDGERARWSSLRQAAATCIPPHAEYNNLHLYTTYENTIGTRDISGPCEAPSPAFNSS